MIIVVSQRIPYPPNKGEKLRTYYQVKHLVDAGHKVVVYSLRHDKRDDEHAIKLSQSLGVDVELFTMPSRPIRLLAALIKGQALSVGEFYSHHLKKRLALDSITHESFTLLVCASSLAPYVLHNRQFKRDNCRLLMDFMDVDSDKWRQYSEKSNGVMKWIYNRESNKIKELEIATNREFDTCFLIAEAEITLFEDNVSKSKPVEKLNNGMDFDAFYPATDELKALSPTFLFAGVMDYKPNIDAVLWFYEKCWRQIKTEIPDAQLVIAGMNPTALITDLAKQNDIHVTGFVDDILPYFHQAWAFIAPFQLARGVQNKVLQASACKLPIVTTPMGAEGIDFANSSTMYIEDDVFQFAIACINAVKDTDNASVKAERAYDSVRHSFSWATKLKPLENALINKTND